ncbi:hypothetical protein NCAS_0A05020 [Naumovozyma castellii]|uniref:BZIP domain-containing protein n=1 Tax=Naumovozyma castellii TaxID=27288 RepID=G0V6G7_NAUCA|nr:hypothetical protein NCAS_0A05020 [Naumovozyma castellii CBS 4309]CCC67060.1 hypothetical protein NCAS_0A05020 [Naumovozyma castellii CBS 4309]
MSAMQGSNENNIPNFENMNFLTPTDLQNDGCFTTNQPNVMAPAPSSFSSSSNNNTLSHQPLTASLSPVTPLHITSSTSSNKNSKSEELDLKQKKKEQNRAAQKAFRERKENELKRLQDELLKSEQNRLSLTKEIENLKTFNTEVKKENQCLLKNNNNGNNNMSMTGAAINMGADSHKFSFPTEDQSFHNMLEEERLSRMNSPAVLQPDDPLLNVPATWEYLNQVAESIDIDISFVLDRLKESKSGVCTGNGVGYRKSTIDEMVQMVSHSN